MFLYIITIKKHAELDIVYELGLNKDDVLAKVFRRFPNYSMIHCKQYRRVSL